MSGASECAGPTSTIQALPASVEPGHLTITGRAELSYENKIIGPEGAMYVDNPQMGKLCC